ncbi:glycine-rich domain-containing protein [Candidatus Entotheonella palauensis]|uniref:Uncharacterized protein n=1 Tax=Candidatus Entotheonella gemina TaxID=1429439 RepID=W4MF04_9BACT|nr:hypothetical protein [Candidatus Entotheonella palauensis]ETX08755.1 MAG: hypothetical protein ETSY2_03515 [Candidatus Entotheonella gemina]
MLDRKEVVERAMSFPMDKVIYRYQQEKQLSTVQAQQHERELKRFLALVALNDKGYGMNGPIDALWHTFILFTKQYQRFCQEVAGRFIHHEPNVAGFEEREARDVDGAVRPGSDSYEAFLKDYQEMFDEVPSARIWPQPVKAALRGEASAGDECRGRPGDECRGMPGDECRGVPDDECRGILESRAVAVLS